MNQAIYNFWINFWIIFWIESAEFSLNWIIFWIESWVKQYWIEYWMNQFLAKFKHWIESDWVSPTPRWSPGQAGGIIERSGLLLISSPIIGSFTHFGLSENDRCSDLEHFPTVQKVRLWLWCSDGVQFSICFVCWGS